MVKIGLFLSLFILSHNTIFGQFQIGVTGSFVPTVATNLGSEMSISGGGLGVLVNYDLIYPLGVSMDITMNAAHFGADLMLGWSFFNLHNLNPKGNAKLGAKVRLGTGIGLFKPKPLFEVQLGVGMMYRQSLGTRCVLQVDLSIRYDRMVNYSQFSALFAYWNLPLTLSFVWRLGKVEGKKVKLGGEHHSG